MIEFDLTTQEKLALYLGYGIDLQLFQAKLKTIKLTNTLVQAVINILTRIQDLDAKAATQVGLPQIKRVEEIEFTTTSSISPDTYKSQAADLIELLGRLLGIPPLYNMYSLSVGGCYAAIQIR